MPTPHPNPKHLIPRRAPGHAKRTALHGAGVSVSSSTVKREVARPPVPREPDQQAQFQLDQFQLNGAAQLALPTPRPIGEATCRPADSTSEAPRPTLIKAAQYRNALGVLSEPSELLRSLWRARQPP